MRLLTRPISESYSIQFGNEALRQELDGGRGRYRLDILNASKTVDMTWILDPEQYTYFMAFYRLEAAHGSEPFEMLLVVDEASTEVECTCSFKSPPKLGEQRGLSYTVSASIEVESPYNAEQDDDDEEIIDDYNTSQGYDPSP